MPKNLKINLAENFQRSYWWELFKNRNNKNPVLNIVEIKTARDKPSNPNAFPNITKSKSSDAIRIMAE